MERDLVAMLREGDLDEANLRGAVDGCFGRFGVRRADVVLAEADADSGRWPETEEL